MPKYFYEVRDATGKKIQGAEDASNEEEIIVRLQARGLFVISVLREFREEAKGLRQEIVSQARFKPRHYRITSEDLALFCRQLSTLLGAGVTILKSLDIISQQVASRRLYNVIGDLRRNMEHGLSLHESMGKHPTVFSELWVNLVESGEAGGSLAIVLSRLAGYLERNAAFRRKIISALIYPIILMLAGLGALLFLTIRIIPTLATLFQGFNMELPFLTRALIAVSVFIRRFIIILIAGSIVGFFLLKRYTRTKEGRLQYERLKFSLPTFGDFFRALIVERFSSNMATLLESGVPILYCLEITEHSVANSTMAGIIREIKDAVREGKALSQPLERSGFFEPMVVQMVSIGEEIGELSQMFKKINAFYQEYIETFLIRFTAMFEPIMLIFMGVIIGIMVIGMFLPIFQIAKIGG